MKRVGVREFRDHATEYLAADEELAVERHGRQLGIFIPTDEKRNEIVARALERLEQTVQQIIAETGYPEEQLGQLYDIKAPVSELPDRPKRPRAVTTDAPDR